MRWASCLSDMMLSLQSNVTDATLVVGTSLSMERRRAFAMSVWQGVAPGTTRRIARSKTRHMNARRATCIEVIPLKKLTLDYRQNGALARLRAVRPSVFRNNQQRRGFELVVAAVAAAVS